jgi:hypothetical protein
VFLVGGGASKNTHILIGMGILIRGIFEEDGIRKITPWPEVRRERRRLITSADFSSH